MTTPAAVFGQSEFLSRLDSSVDDVAAVLDDIIDRAGDRIEHVLLGGKVLGGPLAWWAAEEIWDRFIDAAHEVVDAFRQAVSEIQAAARQLLGDPPAMLSLSDTYGLAHASLTEHGPTLKNATTVLGLSWSGRAYEAYATVAEQQAVALDTVAQAFDQARLQMAAAAEQLVLVWLEQVKNVVDTSLDLVSRASGLADAGNVVTFEVGPIIDLLAGTAQGVVNAVDIWARYAVTVVPARAQWKSITDSVTEWPVPLGRLDDVIRTPGDWDGA